MNAASLLLKRLPAAVSLLQARKGKQDTNETISRYVQYGCGWSSPEPWRNFDASPTLRFERIPIVGQLYTRNHERFPSNVEYGDIVHGLPVPDNSCLAVYCSHVLEHLALNDFRRALCNTYRILAVGGIFRMVLPDLERAIEAYQNNPSSDAAINFLKETSLGMQERRYDISALLAYYFGNSQHLWLWDYKAIEKELITAGFRDVRRANMGDSADPTFLSVEESDRWEGALGVECRR